jgi:glycosyltransferase involved in cell wall biosynthesis
MYPSARDPQLGVFVKQTVEVLRAAAFEVRLLELVRTGALGLSYASFWSRSFVETLASRSDIYFVHYASHSTIGVMLARAIRPKARVVINVHGGDVFPDAHQSYWVRAWKQRVSRWALRRSDAVIVPSEAFKARLETHIPLPCPVHVYPSGGVDASVFEMPAGGSRDLMVFCGRMIPGKGALDAARAFAAVEPLATRQGLTCMFIGDGPERALLERQFAAQLARGYFRVSGFLSRPQLARVFGRAQLIAFPSARLGESLGLTPIEAGFCGAQIFALGADNCTNLLPPAQHSQFGFATPGELGDKLRSYLQMPEARRDEHRHVQHDWLAARYEMSRCDQKLVEIFDTQQVPST